MLADALPLGEIQRRLDAAAAMQPSAELSDHRVTAAAVQAEWRLLRRADRLLAAHRDVVRVLQAAGLSPQVLDWVAPKAAAAQSAERRTAGAPRTIVFPASALARKGADQLAHTLRGLKAERGPSFRLVVLGSPPSDASLWSSLDVHYERYEGDWLQRADVVVLPAIVEHAPRALLAALAHCLPVIATPACGLAPHPLLTEVPAGDATALRQALVRALLPPAGSGAPAPARQFAA